MSPPAAVGTTSPSPAALRKSSSLLHAGMSQMLGPPKSPTSEECPWARVTSSKSHAEENVWVRETTDNGRTYFYNRATGASQWHVPNDLYKSKCLDKEAPAIKGIKGIFRRHEQDRVRMPGSARAVYGVDCVTERPGGGDSQYFDDEDDSGAASEDGDAEAADSCASEMSDSLVDAVAKPSMLLQVTIVSARGLRDTDFMGGSKDKSDPYCTCEFGSKRWSHFRTPTLFDQLDPVWNFTHLMRGYNQSDSLQIAVLDDDRTANILQNSEHMGRKVSSGNIFDQTDDLLGSLTIPAEHVLDESGAPREFQLEEAGDDQEAFVTLQTKQLRGYPELESEHVAPAVRALKRVLGVDKDDTHSVLAVEKPDEHGCEVASYDKLFKQCGYAGNFFGAFSESVKKLLPGSLIELRGEQYTVAEVGAEGSGGRAAGKEVRYVHLTEPIRNGPVRDGARWRKVTQKAEGEDPNRVVVVFDPVTDLIVGVPVFG